MCDLFGLSCNEEDRATKSLPKFANEFANPNSTYGSPNLDGWGIAYFNKTKSNKGIVQRASDGSGYVAAESTEFFKVVDEALSTNIIAHLRNASPGTGVCGLNCHPFPYRYHGRDWIFAHNGYVRKRFDKHPDAKGTTDSETIFLYIMQYVNEHMIRGRIHGLYPAMKKAVRQILRDYPGIKLNFLMSDGNMQYAFSHYDGKPMYIQQNLKGYGNAILLSTQDFGDGNWEKIPEDTLLVLNCGEVIVRSDPIRI